MMKKITLMLLSSALLATVTACGQKGPLYIPNKSSLAALAATDAAMVALKARPATHEN
ncbi:lipoprotein [Undibacterium sp. Jales W-56]|uniref:LPS translocon maturation chaperone LptM n=1 Tax=Undibacterium sp. Jales W-56 TaxID=2897325 RepID=UPI0021D1CD90|nr:lipoprotein [Undibacterium sp. Jales W-56]MCU6432199.1 lipoprotein [Undibacterium sp. Jales W-56]